MKPTFVMHSKHVSGLKMWAKAKSSISKGERNALAVLLIGSTSFAVYNLAVFIDEFTAQIENAEQFFSINSMGAAGVTELNGASMAHLIDYMHTHGNFPKKHTLGYVL